MGSIKNVAEKPTDTSPPPGPPSPPSGQVTRGERLAQEVNKSPTTKDAALTFE